jgi:hypothetical protein
MRRSRWIDSEVVFDVQSTWRYKVNVAKRRIILLDDEGETRVRRRDHARRVGRIVRACV